jgi:uncharacterized protein YceK
MKKTSILSMVGTALLMVFLVGCSSIYETTDDNQARSYNQRYRDNDIYRNNNNSPILVQDRYTGKYFYVYPANTYSSNDYYGYDRNYYSGRTSYYNGNRTYSNGSSTTRDSRSTVTDEQRRDQRANDESARKQILGKKGQ